MTKVLVTGMSGTGKSTVLTELGKRGHRVVDTDYGGWSEDVPLADGRGLERLWCEARVSALLTGRFAGCLFVSGCVANQGRFYGRFDGVILLSVPPDVALARISERTTNDFGTPNWGTSCTTVTPEGTPSFALRQHGRWVRRAPPGVRAARVCPLLGKAERSVRRCAGWA